MRPVLLEVDHVPGQHDGTAIRQAHQQGLVSGRMTRRGNDHDRAVAEHVEIAAQLDGRVVLELAVERGVEVELRRVRSEGGVVLGLLDVELGRGEQVGVADVIGVEMREGDVGHRCGRDTQRLELRSERLAHPQRQQAARRRDAFGLGGDGIGHPRVPEKQPVAMHDEVAVVAELPGDADVDAGRPVGGDVVGLGFTALEHVHAVHRAGGVGGVDRTAERHGAGQRREAHRLHQAFHSHLLC